MVSLGHASFLGLTGYAAVSCCSMPASASCSRRSFAIVFSTACGALFGLLALRASGIGFLMITLALGQIVWGIAYRANTLTEGDNGIRFAARPRPFGIDISGAPNFYWFTLIVFAIALFFIWRVTRSPFGAALQGARDQPRRMRMLGHNVWLIQWLAFVLASFWGSVAGLLYVYYNLFISPHAISLQQSAEVLLMAILGGASTLTGPIVGAVIITLVKNVVSTYVDRWNSLLGAIFVVVIMFMPFGIVPGVQQLWARCAAAGESRAQARGRMTASARHARARSHAAEQALRRAAGDARSVADRDAGRAAADHRAERRRQDHAVQPRHRRSHAGCRLGEAVRTGAAAASDAAARASRACAHLPDPHAVPEGDALPQRRAGAARPRQDALEPVAACLAASASSTIPRAKRSRSSGSAPAPIAPSRRPHTANGAGSKWRWRWRRSRRCCCSTSRSPGLSQEERSQVRELLARVPRDVTIVMIEHDMDSALAFAERITLLHYGEVIVEGTRAEVVADPRTKEVYLGE